MAIDGHFGGLGAVGVSRIDRKWLEAVGNDRDHAVSRLFQEPRIDAGHRHRGRSLRAGLVGAVGADHDVLALAAGAVDDGDGLVVSAWSLPGRGLRSLIGLAGGRSRLLFVRRQGLAQCDLRDGFAAQRIVGEEGDGREGDQEQAEQHGQGLHRGERQPKPALLALRFLSERRAQFVGRFRHEPPRINLLTIARRAGFERLRRGQKRPVPVLPGEVGAGNKKGGPRAALVAML